MKNVIGYVILIALGSGGLGYLIGQYHESKFIDKKIDTLEGLIKEVKDKNNKMLSNTAEVYKTVNNTEGQFTDFDEYLMSFWMD